MLVAARLARRGAVALCRASSSSSVSCGPTPLSRARVAANALRINNLQARRLVSSAKIEKNPFTSEDLLEKQVATLSSDIHQKNRVYKSDLLRVLSNVKENNYSTMWQGLLLLKCCAELLPDESTTSRMALAEQVWNTLKPHTTFTTDHYNELLRCYIANERSLNAANFIAQMSPAKPNVTTYELMLQAICEAGELNQAAELISNMRALGVSATEKIFNSLIIGQGRTRNIKNIEEVLTMMKTLKVPISVETHVAISKAHVLNKDEESALQQLETARNNGFQLQENHIMDIVKCAALQRLNSLIPKILKFLPEKTLSTPSISAYMQSVTTQLVFLNCPLAALEVYKCLPLPSFGPKDDPGLHGRSLVRDCVRASMPSSVIAAITQELMSTGRNGIALQNACEAALLHGRTPLALDLLARMKQAGLPLRPHYFWPILAVNLKSYGEKGLMNTLSTMISMEVPPDYDTILEYILPHVSFSSPQNLLKKLVGCGLTISDVLTPMLYILVSTGQIRAASELCELFEGKIDSDKLIDPLIKGYLTNKDVHSTVYILEEMSKRAMQKNKDWLGLFLCKFVTNKKIKHDRTDFVDLVKALKKTELKMSASATDLCVSHFASHLGSGSGGEGAYCELKEDLEAITDEGLVDESEMFLVHIPHPRSMDEGALRAHLSELEAQGMNTRGVLRKLLQTYCRRGNLKSAREILDKCHKEDIFLSAGMKASIFDMQVKSGELELAEETLADITKTSPKFILDEFKVIDFATLMVEKNKILKACDLIIQQSQRRRVLGGRNIELNCWRLLDAIAAIGTVHQVHYMLNLLQQNRYCRPNNVILGPLVRIYLRSGDVTAAVNEFSQIATKHKCTPLKHELLCNILTDGAAASGGGGGAEAAGAGPIASEPAELKDERNTQLLELVMQACRKVHGAADTQLSLISALADVGYKKSLRKLLLDPKLKLDGAALRQRCQRFVDEKKLGPVEVIAECARDLRHIDTDALYDVMLQSYQRNDDCEGALSLWYKMQEDDVRPSQKFVLNLASLLRANNKVVPPEVLSLLDKDSRSQVFSK